MTINDGYSKLSAFDGPPAYDTATISDSISTLPLESITSGYAPNASPHVPHQPSNEIAIIHKSSPIVGSYTIDTSIRIPAGLRPQPSSLSAFSESLSGIVNNINSPGGFLGGGFFRGLEDRGVTQAMMAQSNACFKSDGRIEVMLRVRGGPPAIILAESKGFDTRGIKMAIVSLSHSTILFKMSYSPTWFSLQTDRAPGTVLNINLVSSSRIRVSLPSDWNGLVKGGTENGSVIFSPALQSRVATFAVDQLNPRNGTYFIGDWASAFPPSGASATASSSRDTPEESWKGDILNVTVMSGHDRKNIEIETWEEREAEIADEERKKTERGTGFGGWIKAVGRAIGTCCVGFGGLVAVCFGCDNCH